MFRSHSIEGSSLCRLQRHFLVGMNVDNLIKMVGVIIFLFCPLCTSMIPSLKVPKILDYFLQGINIKTTEMQDNARSFSSMANELLRSAENDRRSSWYMCYEIVQNLDWTGFLWVGFLILLFSLLPKLSSLHSYYPKRSWWELKSILTAHTYLSSGTRGG